MENELEEIEVKLKSVKYALNLSEIYDDLLEVVNARPELTEKVLPLIEKALEHEANAGQSLGEAERRVAYG